MEIIKKEWTRNELLNNIGKATYRKAALQTLKEDTVKVDKEIDDWVKRAKELKE